MVAINSLASAVQEPQSSRRVDFRSGDGLRLAAECCGDPHSPGLLFTHGFGQTRHAWSDCAAAFADEGWYCLSADARGHGDSEWSTSAEYDFSRFVDDLDRLAAQVPQPPSPILIGASMGGLLGLVAQSRNPQLFRALVLVDVTPRWETAGVERILNFMRAHPQGFDNLEHAASEIASYLPHRAERKSPERLRQLLIPTDGGRLRWHWDPRLLDLVSAVDHSLQQQLIEAARTIAVPTLLISGEKSDVVSDSTIAEFLSCIPHAQHVRVAHATHMVVGDRNDAFTTAVKSFIQPLRNDAGSAP